MNLKKYLLLSVAITTLIFSACTKDEEEETKILEAEPPTVEINGKTTGDIISLPQEVLGVNFGRLNSHIQEFNKGGKYAIDLNTIPTTASSTKNADGSLTYHWITTVDSVVKEIWYKVDDSTTEFNITYDMEINYLNIADSSFQRTNIVSGSVAKNGKTGNLTIKLGELKQDDSNPYMEYKWNINTPVSGSNQINMDYFYENEDGSSNQSASYEIIFAADGSGRLNYTESYNPEVRWAYTWTTNWSVIIWKHYEDGLLDEDKSGEWSL